MIPESFPVSVKGPVFLNRSQLGERRSDYGALFYLYVKEVITTLETIGIFLTLSVTLPIFVFGAIAYAVIRFSKPKGGE